VRVAIGASGHEARPGATGEWVVRDAWGRIHARGTGDPEWVVERRNRRVRLTFDGSQRVTAWSEEPFTLAAIAPSGVVRWNGRRFRGTLAFVPVDTAILVVNHLDLESYLRGVVPLELGVRSPAESAALEAQAIAARSYVVVRQREAASRRFDLTSGATDQVYGGMDAEHPIADAAVLATAGLVLTYGGAVVRAPYHSTCGGRTVAASEAWAGVGDEPYLRGVSDLRDGTDRAWCEISPRFSWQRTLDRRDLDAAVGRYVSANGAGVLADPGGVRGARIERRTRSGRVATLALTTEGGTMRLSGTALRTTLRSARGEIVNSTYFSIEPIVGRDGRLMQLTLQGTGNGHGVGMCQWGAIARARAGHDAREILAAYYPGTIVATRP
jgi:stage II sporulation protein D